MNKEYYGAIEKYNDTDYKLDEININLLTPIVIGHKIQYNQPDVNNSACTLYAGLGILSNMFGKVFENDTIISLIQQAKEDGFKDGKGWWVYKAVDLIRNFWNKYNKEDRVVTFSEEINSDKFWKLLKKGYVCQGGFSGDRNFSKDKRDNCDIDTVIGSKKTYGHSIQLFYSDGDIFVQDSYSKYKCNVYKVSKFKELVDNGIYFHKVYFYIPKRNIMTQLEKDIADIEKAFELGITNNKDNITNIKKGNYTQDIKTLLFIMRAFNKFNG